MVWLLSTPKCLGSDFIWRKTNAERSAACPHCAGLITNSKKVAAVIWDEPYWSAEGLVTLEGAGVLHAKMSMVEEVKGTLERLLEHAKGGR